MSVLDTFFIRFISDAKDTTKDVAALDKQISELASKGDKRSEEETKQLKALRQLRAGTLQDLKDVDKVASDVNGTFLSLATNALGAVVAFASFDALKNATAQAIGYNAELERQHILTGESAKDIDALDAAFSTSTGKKGEFLQWFNQYSTYLQSIGQDTTNVIPNLKAFATELQGLSDKQARLRFQQLSAVTGLPQDFFIQLRQGGDALDDLQKKMQTVNGITQDGTKNALEFDSAWEKFSKHMAGNLASFVNEIEPTLTKLVNLLDRISTWGGSKSYAQEHLVKTPGDWTYHWEDNPKGKPADDAAKGDAKSPPDGSGGIYIDAPAPNEETQKLIDNPGVKSTLDRALKGDDHSDANDPDMQKHMINMLAEAKKQIGAADSSPLNSSSSVISGGGGSSSKNLQIGSIVIQVPQGSTPNDVAKAVTDSLNQHFRTTIGNADDSVAR